MENSGYNLRQRPFPISTTDSMADSLATIATSSASTPMAYSSNSGSGTGLVYSGPTFVRRSLRFALNGLLVFARYITIRQKPNKETKKSEIGKETNPIAVKKK